MVGTQLEYLGKNVFYKVYIHWNFVGIHVKVGRWSYGTYHVFIDVFMLEFNIALRELLQIWIAHWNVRLIVFENTFIEEIYCTFLENSFVDTYLKIYENFYGSYCKELLKFLNVQVLHW